MKNNFTKNNFTRNNTDIDKKKEIEIKKYKPEEKISQKEEKNNTGSPSSPCAEASLAVSAETAAKWARSTAASCNTWREAR